MDLPGRTPKSLSHAWALVKKDIKAMKEGTSTTASKPPVKAKVTKSPAKLKGVAATSTLVSFFCLLSSLFFVSTFPVYRI